MRTKSYGRWFWFIFWGSLGLFSQPDPAEAVSITENTTYALSGSFYLYFLSTTGDQSYQFQGTYLNGSTVDVGDESNKSLDQVIADGILSFKIYQWDNGKGVTGPLVGTATGSLDAAWSDVAYDEGEDVAAARKGEASGGALFFNVNGSMNGAAFSFASALDQKFASLHISNAVYKDVVASLGTLGYLTASMVLGDISSANPDAFKAWFMAAGAILSGKSYNLSGDIHGYVSQSQAQVPEPASIALLAAGLLGATRRRRKKESDLSV